MLELRQNCENCNTSLPPDSTQAMICTYECTFCKTCVDDVLQNVCPNCTGGFEKRPVRPKAELLKNPATKRVVIKPINESVFKPILESFKNVPPFKR